MSAARISTEPLRLLARRSELAYVDRPDLALEREPEAVSAACQRALVQEAQRAAAQHGLADWRIRYRALVVDVDGLRRQTYMRRFDGELRTLIRMLERLDERVIRSLH